MTWFRRMTWAVFAASLLMAACGDEPTPSDADTDGGDGGDAATSIAPMPPEIPWIDEGAPPLALTPCPEGWTQVSGTDVPECDPYPAGGATSCSGGEAHFPGESGCRPVGNACPSGDFSEDLPAGDEVIYVDLAASPGGDGSLAAPHTSLSDVPWLSLAPGTTVALGKGDHEGPIPLRAGVRVVGACAAETRVVGVAAPLRGSITVSGTGEAAVAQDLTLAGATYAGVFVGAGEAIRLEGVIIERTAVAGVAVVGRDAEAILEDVVVRETAAAGGVGGNGLNVQDGGRLSGNRVIVSEASSVGLAVATADTRAELTDAAIVACDGSGVLLREGGQLAGTRLLVAGNHELGIFADGTGTSATLVDTVIRDTEPRLRDSMFGRGMSIQTPAHLDATRVVVASNHALGIFASGAGTEVTLTDVVIRDTRPNAIDGGGGSGLTVQSGALLTGTRLVVVDNLQAGIRVFDEGTRAVLDDVAISRIDPEVSTGAFGRGLSASAGAEATARRVFISDVHEAAVLAGTDSGAATVTISDVVIRDVHPRLSEGAFGHGLAATTGGRLVASRALIERTTDVAVGAEGEDTAIVLEDVRVLDTQDAPLDGAGGRSLNAQFGGRIDGVRVEVERSRQLAVIAFVGGVITLEGFRAAGVTRAGCGASTCPGGTFGHGVASVGGTLSLNEFAIGEAETCGVFLAASSTGEPPVVDLSQGVVEANAIGACVQVDGYDLSRLMEGVDYRDNGINLDATMLPVPEPAGRLGDDTT